jgi:hypothetical protein
MRGKSYAKFFLTIFVATNSVILGSLSGPVRMHAQERPLVVSSGPVSNDSAPEIRALSELIADLQAQVQSLNSQLGDLRKEQERATEEARDLHRELDLLKAGVSPATGGPSAQYGPATTTQSATLTSSAQVPPQYGTAENRISHLEEDQEVMEGKINDQYQTKVEGGSKYRLRLSGIFLLNMYDNRGTVDNQDFPFLAESPQQDPLYASPGAFGGSLRQSQLRLQAFGPDVAGAHTSADLNFDFAGGLPQVPNGAAMGIVRLRTGTVRLDWPSTSIVAGQDRLFFAPLSPTSLATLAAPSLAYAGDLWAWTPQVRVEHRIALPDDSSLSFQGGLLDSLTGDIPPDLYGRYPSWGEESGQPAYATRISWTRHIFGQSFTIGAAGYYGRQNWGYNRTVDGWAGMTDLTLPLGKRFELTGAFYRGRAVAGLGGGLGQSVLLNGPINSPTTTYHGLDSIGGWAQLKYQVRPNLEINGALGIDNPYARELRQHNAYPTYSGPSLTRNLSPLVNIIYQIRSDILFSVEYRHLNTAVLDYGSYKATHVNMSLGYIF